MPLHLSNRRSPFASRGVRFVKRGVKFNDSLKVCVGHVDLVGRVVPVAHSRAVKSLELFRSKPVIEHFLGQAVYQNSGVRIVSRLRGYVSDPSAYLVPVADS